MRKLALILSTCFLFGTFTFAQKRVEAGIFLDSLNISQTSTDNLGLGVRLGFRVHRNVMFEGELAIRLRTQLQRSLHQRHHWRHRRD